uniref:Uncharacterized protein n=1 Tax=Rhizophora mucronata TaxID=61149 RepID=A0A2P2NZE6_RHIMU
MFKEAKGAPNVDQSTKMQL